MYLWRLGLHMAEDVAGATFMAVASSSPELFINSVGTFITEGDLGIGTILGSAVFNVLAVPACCGLFSNMVRMLWCLSSYLSLEDTLLTPITEKSTATKLRCLCFRLALRGASYHRSLWRQYIIENIKL